MITKLNITNFKCIDEEELQFAPLTIITGKNSSGKSTVLQSLLLLARNCNKDNEKPMVDIVSKYSDAQQTLNSNHKNGVINISATFEDMEKVSISSDNKIFTTRKHSDKLKNEEDIYYTSCNRIGPESIAKHHEEYKIGDNGEYIFSYFEKTYSNEVHEILRVNHKNIFDLGSRLA